MAFCVSHRVHIQQAKRSASKTSWTEQVSYDFVSPLLLGKTTQLKEGKSNSTEP